MKELLSLPQKKLTLVQINKNLTLCVDEINTTPNLDPIVDQVEVEFGINETIEIFEKDRLSSDNSEDVSYNCSLKDEDNTDEDLDGCSDEDDYVATLEDSNVGKKLRNARETVRELKKKKG